MTTVTVGAQALRAMRNERRKNRIADLEWFEALYRVYLAAFLGGGAILFLSSLATDTALTAHELSNVTTNTPHVMGLVTAVVVFLGLRSGANGGPIAVEEAEVRHVLMAPVPHSAVLRHPAVQRMRTFAFAGALAGGTANQLLSRRVEMSDTPIVMWAVYGALAGAVMGMLFVVSALLMHTLHVPRSLVTLLASALLAWQTAVTFGNTHIAGPFDFIGSVAMWWHSFHIFDVLGLVVVALLAALSIYLAGDLSLEALSRRSSLVSQLKFAVTLQDIRTVVLLRRQLSQEHMRVAPWVKIPGVLRRDVVVGRGFRSFAHFPARRLLRMSLLAVVASGALMAVYKGTSPAVVVAGVALFVLGLDAVEPLSQEVDQPDRTDALPLERGLIMTKHLVAPAISTLPFLIVGVVFAWALEPSVVTIGYGFLIGLPAILGGIAGASINAVKGAPDPVGGATVGLAMPPEMSGMGTVLRMVWPPAVSVMACLPILLLKYDHTNNLPALGDTVRSVLGVAFLLMLVGGWVRQRDAIHAWFRNAVDQSKSQTSSATQSSTSYTESN